ncbi:hypothetical protein LTR49_023674 [Elasticomyces elasticus]|nr:hypothetical protein LTR49_023674 [Elasticomyces elasticus]KAK5747782.1 hypothetical protein LTS12_022181 [Elasticomyces elasticus]
MPQSPMSQSLVQSATHLSPAISRNGCSRKLAARHVQSPKQIPTAPEQHHQRLQPSRQVSFSSPFSAGFEQMSQGAFSPLTTQLPMGAQQMLVNASPIGMTFSYMMSQLTRYSYNPNGKPKDLDAALPRHQLKWIRQEIYMLSPRFNDPMLDTPQTPTDYLAMPGMPMGMNNGYEHHLESANNRHASGHVTPQNVGWSNSWSTANTLRKRICK